jgi:hypothetical protein
MLTDKCSSCTVSSAADCTWHSKLLTDGHLAQPWSRVTATGADCDPCADAAANPEDIELDEPAEEDEEADADADVVVQQV